MNGVLALLLGRASCPAKGAEKEVVDNGFRYLRGKLGLDSSTKATVIEPTAAFFPDRYDASQEAATGLFERVCGYMHIDPAKVVLDFWEEEQGRPLVDAPGVVGASPNTKGASGYYQQRDGLDHVSLNMDELKDPMALVATIAHELAHVVLLSHNAMPRVEPHMEAITDLATIYLGMGIFTANSLLRQRAWTEGNAQGWSVSRKGYISPEMAGWALSLFAWSRGEKKPEWAKHLTTDPRSYLKQGLRFIRQSAGAPL